MHNMIMPGRYFITGTDTDCGKTYVTLQLMKILQQQGKKVLGIKPIAAGGKHTQDGFRNEDALLLQEASDFSPSYAQVNPFCFEIPASPHIAADAMGVSIQAAEIAQHCLSYDVSAYDYVFFEGAGGVFAPISMQETLCDVIKAMRMPAIVVVGMKLGCLNHALLSFQALDMAGIPVAAWVANPIDPDMSYFDENQRYIEKKTQRMAMVLALADKVLSK